MNDDVLKILLTESDVNLIMNALTFLASEFDNDGDGFTGALELHDDLLEQVARQDDPDWDIEPTEIEEVDALTGKTFQVAENDFFNAGVAARQHLKASGSPPRDKEVGTSRASMRRSDHLKAPRGLYSADVYLKPNEILDKYRDDQSRKTFSFSVTENDFIDHQSRAIKTAESQRSQNAELSETQMIDLWERPNDPTKW
jgi:hypothetical protein